MKSLPISTVIRALNSTTAFRWVSKLTILPTTIPIPEIQDGAIIPQVSASTCMTTGDGAVTTDGTIPTGDGATDGTTHMPVGDGVGTTLGDTIVGDGAVIMVGDIPPMVGDMPDIMAGEAIITTVGGPITTIATMAETMPMATVGAAEDIPTA